MSSKALMSIGTIAMFLNVLIGLNYKKTISDFYKNKALFSVSLLFFSSIIALIVSSDKAEGFHYVINKLSLIVIPLALSRFENFSKEKLYFILNFFVLTAFVSGSIVILNYYQDFEIATNNLKQGMAIWVPLNHIHYGVVLVLAFVSSVYLFIKRKEFLSLKFKSFKYLYLFIAIVLFVIINILAIRTALLTMYLTMLVSIVFYFIKTKNFKTFALFSVLIISLPFLAYYNIESVTNRLNYMKYDWEQYIDGNIGTNSDSRRMLSYKVGFELVKTSFPLGFGVATTKKEISKHYKNFYPEVIPENRIVPHNQFLYILIDYGLIGFIAICLTFFYPIISIKNKSKNLYFILFWIIVVTPLFYDVTLEMQHGITFFALFSSLILKQISFEEKNLKKIRL